MQIKEITREMINEKAKQLVEQEVYCNVDSLVRFSINRSHDSRDAPVTWDEEIDAYPDFSDYDRGECLEWLEDNTGNDPDDYEDYTGENLQQECRDEYQPEIYEYWAISSWLGGKLKEQGGIVIDAYPVIWGRETTGQLIFMDGIFKAVAKKLLEKYAAYD